MGDCYLPIWHILQYAQSLGHSGMENTSAIEQITISQDHAFCPFASKKLAYKVLSFNTQKNFLLAGRICMLKFTL